MLTPKKKLTKKELKHDPLLDSLEKGKEIYEEYSKQIVTAIGAIVVIMLLGWGWMNSQESRNNEAMLAGTKVTLAALSGTNDNIISELESVVDEYGNNSNVSQAAYQLGITRMNSGDIAGARELFTQMANNSDMSTKIAGKLKLAYLYEKESNYGDAAALYSEVAGMSKHLVSDYAKLQAGYAFLAAGNVPQAENLVAELLAEEPSGKFKEYVKYLEGKVLEK